VDQMYREKVRVSNAELFKDQSRLAEQHVLEVLFHDAMRTLLKDGGNIVKLEIERKSQIGTDYQTYTMPLTTTELTKGEARSPTKTSSAP